MTIPDFPVGIVMVALAAIGGIYWLGKLSEKVDNIVKVIGEIKTRLGDIATTQMNEHIEQAAFRAEMRGSPNLLLHRTVTETQEKS